MSHTPVVILFEIDDRRGVLRYEGGGVLQNDLDISLSISTHSANEKAKT